MTVAYARIVVLVAVAAVGVVRFEVFCIADLGRTSDADLLLLTRTGWLAVIVLFIPIGGLAFLYRGKAQ